MPARGLLDGASGRRSWCVLDTHFGDAGRFLATWQDWQRMPDRPTLLHYVGLTAWPAAAECLCPSSVSPEGHALVQQLLSQWHGLLPGFHRLVFDNGRVQLTLGVGEEQNLLREQPFEADVVWLEGLDLPATAGSPSEAPPSAEAQLPRLLKTLSQRCRRGTRVITAPQGVQDLAVLSAALSQAGFQLPAPLAAVDREPPRRTASSDGEVLPGQSLQGEFNPRWTPRKPAAGFASIITPGRCVVIGGGLSGASVAASLALRGWQVEVLDRSSAPAAGASGLPAGLVAPHVSPDDRALSRLSRAGVRATLQRARVLLDEGRDWGATGVLEHRVEGKHALPATWAQAAAHHQPHPGLDWSAPATARQMTQARLPAEAPGLWHAQAAWIKPAALVRALLAQPGITWRGGQNVAGLRHEATAATAWQVLDAQGRPLATADLVVVAAGFDTLALVQGDESEDRGQLPLNPLRGQIAWGPMPSDAALISVLPPFPVNGHGSLVAGVPTEAGPAWFTGSTFERANPVPELHARDHQANLERLATLLPDAARVLAPAFEDGTAQAWAGVRCTVPDRVPVVGPLHSNAPGLWVCTGMGARGLTLAMLSGELVAAWLHGEPLPVEQRLARLLMAQRFARQPHGASLGNQHV
jgi:tRNA 5-methylaminomethyl-2-thiouridine biosynthesis bifunctional protein